MSDAPEVNSPRDAMGPTGGFIPPYVEERVQNHMSEDERALIVQGIMRQYDMETYHGFGMLTIKMLAKMLNEAVKAGEERGARPF